MVTEYSEKLYEKANKVTEQVAHDFSEKLRKVTPRSNTNTEHTADTIMVSTKKEKFYGRTSRPLYVHYGKWQLVHLLEFGWTSKDGKRIDRKPFIRPLFDNNKETYYRMYKEALSNGN